MHSLTLLNKLAELEKSYQEKNIIDFLKHPVEFEEIPIITRKGREDIFLELFSKKDFDIFFLNVALFYLNNIKLIARKVLSENERKDLFLCITYPDLELSGLYGFNIPNICISKAKYKEKFEEKPKVNLDQMLWLKDSLEQLGYIDTFKIVYSKSDDGFGEEFSRVFLLNRE